MTTRSGPAATDAASLHRDALVIDAHAHAPGFVPPFPRRAYRLVNRRTMPPDLGLDRLAAAGVDAVVVKAVGDPIVTRWHRGGPWDAVLTQLDDAVRQAGVAGADLVTDMAGITAARARGRLAVLLGLEGADALEGDVDRVDALYGRGVRVVVLVHLGDNDLGTTCLPWQRYVGPLPVRRRAPGLTDFGAAVVRRMNELGLVVDVSHADERTLLDIVGTSRAPVIASHAGARACQDFARFLSDEAIAAVAGTGGVVGLWPYHHRGKGVPDLAALVAHARHVAGIAGAGHLCLGTDLNGVPGTTMGYRDARDLPNVTAALLAGGFASGEVAAILGGNVARVLREVAAASGRAPG